MRAVSYGVPPEYCKPQRDFVLSRVGGCGRLGNACFNDSGHLEARRRADLSWLSDGPRFQMGVRSGDSVTGRTGIRLRVQIRFARFLSFYNN